MRFKALKTLPQITVEVFGRAIFYTMRCEIGCFNQLSDEVLIDKLLPWLESCALCQIGSTCSFLYIFCNEDSLWQVLCLKQTRGAFTYKNSWKTTFYAAACGIKRPFTVNSLFLLDRWKRSNCELGEFVPDEELIPRVGMETMSKSYFKVRFDGPRNPGNSSLFSVLFN